MERGDWVRWHDDDGTGPIGIVKQIHRKTGQLRIWWKSGSEVWGKWHSPKSLKVVSEIPVVLGGKTWTMRDLAAREREVKP